MYKVILTNKALKDFDNLPDNIFLKIDKIIESLKLQPRLIGSIKLTDFEGYRIRVGDYRMLYKINDSINEIQIFKISHRKDVYRKN